MLLRPPHLRTGDTVYLLSTARKITISELSPAISIMESWGLKVETGKTIDASDWQFAGTDDLRREDFQYAMDSPHIKAIICARGGYGTVRMMDELNFDEFMKLPKWIVGYSDVTFLHTHISNNIGIQSIHSTMPVSFPKCTPEALETLRRELFGEGNRFTVPANSLNRNGNTEGILIGGNLSILYGITGTKSGINTAGKILLLEDVDEYLYHVDRMMMNLKRSGKLNNLAGLIVGGFSQMRDNTKEFGFDNDNPFGKTAYEIVAGHVKEFGYPVCFDFPSGHIEDNRAVVIGRKYKMNVSSQGSEIY